MSFITSALITLCILVNLEFSKGLYQQQKYRWLLLTFVSILIPLHQQVHWRFCVGLIMPSQLQTVGKHWRQKKQDGEDVLLTHYARVSLRKTNLLLWMNYSLKREMLMFLGGMSWRLSITNFLSMQSTTGSLILLEKFWSLWIINLFQEIKKLYGPWWRVLGRQVACHKPNSTSAVAASQVFTLTLSRKIIRGLLSLELVSLL